MSAEQWKAEPSGRSPATWEIRTKQRLLLAEVNPAGMGVAFDAERDAKKMAAAPDLLDALAMWIEDPVTCATQREPAPRIGCDCWACERTRIAHAAIAKATGAAS